jgi:hypothetical protein
MSEPDKNQGPARVPVPTVPPPPPTARTQPTAGIKATDDAKTAVPKLKRGRRRAFVISAIIVVLAIVGGVIGVVLTSTSSSSSPGPTPKPAPSPPISTTPLPTSIPAPPLIPGGVSPPSSINDTCSQDVTTPLAQWLYSLPNAKPTRTIVDFGKGCYEVDGQMWLRGFKNWVFEGGTIEQKTVKAGKVDISFVPKVAPYCGSDAFGNSAGAPDGKVDITFFMEGGCDITFLDMRFFGPNGKGKRGGQNIQDTAITFAGTQRGLVDHISVRDPFGDYVDTQGLHEAPHGGGEYRAEDITVENSTFSGAGREGIGIIISSRIVIEDNTFYSAAETMFDIEFDAYCECGKQEDILIADNTIVGQHYAFLLAAVTAAEIDRFRFTGNNLIDGAQMRIDIAPQTPSKNVEIDHNTATGAAIWPHRASITISNVTGALVLDNTSPIYPWQPGDAAAGPFARISSGEVEGNKLTLVPSPTHQPGNVVVTQGGSDCGNVSEAGASLDSGCSSTPQVQQPQGAAAPS